MKKTLTPDEFMQQLLPGSKTFAVRMLCPCCGWHFKDGLTDPSGQHSEPVAGVVLVCGQCLHVLQVTEKKDLAALSKEEIEALEPETRAAIADSWRTAYAILMVTGSEPKGPRH